MNATDIAIAKQETPLDKVEEKAGQSLGVVDEGMGAKESAAAVVVRRRSWKKLFATLAFVLLTLVIVLAVTLSGGDAKAETIPPIQVDFVTGVSLITSYNINATISQRLARSVLTMEVANALDCTSIHGITLQLPDSARVASLRTIADDGCETHGDVQPLADARETFTENAAAGLPGAYVEARGGTTYSLQVSLPPMGTTVVELVTEEVLRQEVGNVSFKLPLVPNEQVDQVSLEVTILDANSKIFGPVIEVSTNGTDNLFSHSSGLSFELDLGSDFEVGNVISPFKLKIPDAREYNLPRIMQGNYKPHALPDQGVLYQDAHCFEYTFLPGSLDEPKAKNLFFLIDISGYGNEPFLRHTKLALKDTIDLLTEEDTLTIQLFESQGTAGLWGSAKMTSFEKDEAKKFLDELEAAGGWGNTNLHEAMLEGLLRAKRDALPDRSQGIVTLMVVLSNSWASSGKTNRTGIAHDVWKLNEEGHVKMFMLGSPSADIQLLNAIALMNGGVTASIVDGMIDYSTQMKNFFESEFGNILLSDVQMSFEADDATQISGETPRFFPVLAKGTEVVVRGLLMNQNSGQEVASSTSLHAVTTAVSPDGSQTWRTSAVADPFVVSLGESNSRCFQSYAHSRITQLMGLRDVALLLGDEVVRPIVTLTTPCNEKNTTFADCIKAEALSLALEAQVVTTGLTGLVTIDSDMCLPTNEMAEICVDGTTKGDYDWQHHTGYSKSDGGRSGDSEVLGVMEYGSSPASAPSSGTACGSRLLTILILGITAFASLSEWTGL